MEPRSQRKTPLSSPRDKEPFPDNEPVRKKRKKMVGIDPSLDDDSTVVAINNTSQLESLPIELLHMIFSYLSTCDKVSLRMVCRRLRLVLDDPDHWRCVIIPPHISAKNPKYVQSVLKHSKSHVQSLSLVGYSSTTSSYLTSCTSITALDVYGSRITNSAMKQLLLRLPNLSRLSISDATAQALLPILPALQQLVITMRPFSHLKNCSKRQIIRNFDCLRSQLTEDSPAKPSNIAIKHVDEYPVVSYFLRFKSYRFGNLSEYELSTANTLKAVSTPSFINKNSVEMGFRIPGIPDADNKPPIIVSTAVSSSVLSANINYTHAYIADSLSPRASTICPSFGDITANVTSLDLKSITLQSLDNVRNIVEFTPNLLVISVNGIQLLNYDDPLDVLFKAVSVYCPKLTSIFAILANGYSNEQCYVESTCEVWNNILSLKYLEHLSVCSCLFQESPVPNDHHLYPNLKLLPISFQSLILHIHQTKRVQIANLDTVIANICNIQRLRMLHLYIDSFRQQNKSGSEPLILNLQLLLESNTNLEELLVKPISSNVRIHSSPAISRLKCLKLINSISVPESFFADLIPFRFGQKNMNLQLLHCEDSCSMHDSEVILFLEHCPSLVSFTCRPIDIIRIAFEALAVKDIGKKYDLLNFRYGYSTRNHRSISSNIDFSVLKLM